MYCCSWTFSYFRRLLLDLQVPTCGSRQSWYGPRLRDPAFVAVEPCVARFSVLFAGVARLGRSTVR